MSVLLKENEEGIAVGKDITLPAGPGVSALIDSVIDKINTAQPNRAVTRPTE